MSDKQNEVSEGHVRVESMPSEVQRLAEVMQSVDPNWTLAEWLVEQARLSLNLVSADLKRERLAVEQRLHRLESIARRLEPPNDQTADPLQKNLFDCFNLEIDAAMKGLGSRAAQPEKPLQDDHAEDLLHPAASFLNLLPDDEGDDPLLAVACQMLLVVVEHEMGKGEPCATLDRMFKGMNEHGVAPDEIDEAIDHLLAIGALIEIDDDCFITTA